MSGRPGGPPPIILEIDRAMRAGDFAAAGQLAERALATGMSHPILFSLRAGVRRDRGELAGALDDLNSAHRLSPKSANVLVTMAEVLNLLGRFADAARTADQALRLEPSSVPALFQKGHALQMSNDLAAAAAAFREAARRAPSLAEVHSRLANLAALQGRSDEARSAANRALALKPRDEIALISLVRADLSDGHLEEADARLTRLVADASLSPESKAIVLGLLGDVRDAQDRRADAYAAYSQSGSLWAGMSPPARETARAMVVRLTDELMAGPAAAWPAPAPPASDRAPVFILGFPRSGTTLLAQILGSIDGVEVLEEKPIHAGIVEEILSKPDAIARLASLGEREIARYRDDVWRRIVAAGDTGNFVIDQNAFNTAYLPAIMRLFPGAKIVLALRDPRDVVFSAFRRQFGRNIFTAELSSLQSAAAFYDAMMRLAETCRTRLQASMLELRNEDVIADFDGTTRRLCDFCGLEWTEAIRNYQSATRERTLATVSATQVRRGINAEGVGQWRRYAGPMAPVLPLLAPWVERFGYPAD